MNSRSQNTIYNSMTGVLLQITTAILALVYRTVLINLLGVEYLGINGLFSNILNLLSLTELGFNIAIAYRMYQPAKDDNKERLAALLNFFEKIYKCVALIVLILGLLVMPFLKYFIKESTEIPKDINLYSIYLLMLVQSASSYLFTSRQMLMQAWQKEYFNNIFQIISTIAKYSVQIAILFICYSYFSLLVVGVLVSICLNIMYYFGISFKYKEVFKCKSTITKLEKNKIFSETKALLMHKIGGVILSSTDNIVISSTIGLKVVGLYSNYVVVVSMISTIICKIFGGATASIGNLFVSETNEKIHDTFLSLSLLAMWVVSYCSICLFCLLNPFVTLWLGNEYTLGITEVCSITFAFYIMYSRYINTTFVNACGIYYLDKYRPLIEAIINLVVSVGLAKIMGLTGVFIGTIISEIVTAWWREPFLLYKNIFHGKSYNYWKMTMFFAFYVIMMEYVCFLLCKLLPVNWLFIFVRIIICTALVNFPLYIIFKKRPEFSMIRNVVNKIRRNKG